MHERVMSSKTDNSVLIRAKLRLFSSPLENAYEEFWASVGDRQKVVDFLVMLHQIMRSSVPLMECAVHQCKLLDRSDPFAPHLASYYAHHASEELNHDKWAMEDLETIGLTKAALLDLTPPAEIASLSGGQYYWVLHHHPLMLLGYLIVLEGYPPTDEKISYMRDASGLPDSAFRTLRLHGELDPTHLLELDDFLDSLPLKPKHISMIGVSMLHVIKSLADRIQTISRSSN